MHVKKYILFCLMALVAIVSGCDKDEKLGDDETKPDNVRKISRIDRYNDEQKKMASSAITYDAQGRIAKIATDYPLQEDPDWVRSESYSYPDAKTVVITYFGDTNGDGRIDDQDDYVETATLNESGYMASLKGSELVDTETRFAYTEKYLTKVLTTNTYACTNFKYIAYEWNDGSLAPCQNRDVSGWKGNLYAYAYDSKTLNQPCSIDLFWLVTDEDMNPLNLLGKSSQYLPDTESVQAEDGLYKAVLTTYRYEKDGDGYVTKIFEKSKDDESERLKYQLTYQLAE
jgi:hypothetical protein